MNNPIADVGEHKPHAVCIPFPVQGHINPMLKLAKLLHHRGFRITFVNTEYNHAPLLKSRGPNGLDGLPDFKFETIPDGLPKVYGDVTQDLPSLCDSTSRTCSVPIRGLIDKLQSMSAESALPVTCIVADGVMTCAADAAEEIGVPFLLLWTMGACGFSGIAHFDSLVDRGFTPMQESQLTNGYLETIVDFIPGMEGISLKDLPTHLRATSNDDVIFNFARNETGNAHKASVILLNTFDHLEQDVLDGLHKMYRKVLTVGPLQLALNQIPKNSPLHSISSNLWRDDPECLAWLGTKAAKSVIYVNYGSIAVMSSRQLIEFAWGPANSNCSFLWIIRPDLVIGDTAILPPEFVEETKRRGLLASWCPQEQVLNHPSIGGFLTHCGWNSTIESVGAGIPMICWAFFADQQTNCWFACKKWGMGMEIDTDVKRNEVEKLVKELMEGDKGKSMKKMAANWKSLAEEAVSPNGTSTANFKKLVNLVLMSKGSYFPAKQQ